MLFTHSVTRRFKKTPCLRKSHGKNESHPGGCKIICLTISFKYSLVTWLNDDTTIVIEDMRILHVVRENKAIPSRSQQLCTRVRCQHSKHRKIFNSPFLYWVPCPKGPSIYYVTQIMGKNLPPPLVSQNTIDFFISNKGGPVSANPSLSCVM